MSSRNISSKNKETSEKHGVRVNVVAKIRQDMYTLLFQIDQSTAITRTQAKALLTDIINQEET